MWDKSRNVSTYYPTGTALFAFKQSYSALLWYWKCLWSRRSICYVSVHPTCNEINMSCSHCRSLLSIACPLCSRATYRLLILLHPPLLLALGDTRRKLSSPIPELGSERSLKVLQLLNRMACLRGKCLLHGSNTMKRVLHSHTRQKWTSCSGLSQRWALEFVSGS